MAGVAGAARLRPLQACGASARYPQVSLNANPIQCVTVQDSTHRLWLRLVGQRHDVQRWDADTRLPVPPIDLSRRYIPPNYGEDVPEDERTADHLVEVGAPRPRAPPPRRLARHLARTAPGRAAAPPQGEKWISDIFEPFRKQYMQGLDLQMAPWDHSRLDFCCLAGVMQRPSDERPTVKEVVVFRCPRCRRR